MRTMCVLVLQGHKKYFCLHELERRNDFLK